MTNNIGGKFIQYFDLIFCVVMLPLMVLFFPIERWIHDYPAFAACLVVWLYVAYYLNRKITVKLFFKSRKYIHMGIGILCLSVFVTWSITQFHVVNPYYNLVPPLEKRVLPHFRMYQQAVWVLFVAVEAFSFLVGVLHEMVQQQEQKRIIEMERQKAEMALYRAQINPHFLFNTLNMLYGMVVTKSERTEETFMQFIDLLKYMSSHADKELVNVADEVSYIEKYVALQRNRLNSCTQIDFDYQHDDNTALIAPMLLMTFVENSLKYGVSSHIECKIDIRVVVQEGVLTFDATNPIITKGKEGGIGLANVKRRLQLLYPNRHTLGIRDDGDTFNVHLHIQL